MGITIDLHPCTKINPAVAVDQMAIYDDENLIGYASTIDSGCINLIVAFNDEEAASIKATVSNLMGVQHNEVSIVPELPNEQLEEDDDASEQE